MILPTNAKFESAPTSAPVWRERQSAFFSWVQQVRWPAFGLLLIAVLVYAPVVRFQFLNWDDSWYILWNDLIKSWHPTNLYRVLTEPVCRNFAPATIGTFLMEHTLWQLWPGGYHATNVLIHLVNALLVLQLLRQLTKNEWLAWMVAALFLVHPVQVESVAWISSRKTLLSSTWMLASCLCWLRVERTHRMEAWGMGWLLLALLSKAAAVVVPPIVIVYDVLVARKKLSDSIARQVIPLFFCMMLILITMNAQVAMLGGVRGHLHLSKWRLLAIDGTLLWRYVGMLIYPQDLCVLYNPPISGITLLIIVAAVAWAGVIWVLWSIRKSQPLMTLAGAAWILLFLPVLNLFPLTTLMNDRYLYLPCVPFFAGAVWCVQQVWLKLSKHLPRIQAAQSPLATAMSAALIGCYAWGTLNYLPVWKDSYALWSYARTQVPEVVKVQIQWALTLHDLGRSAEACAALQQALQQGGSDQAEQDLIESLIKQIAPPS